MAKRKLEERETLVCVFLTLLTLGFYGLYWFVVTKRDIVSRGGNIPTCWLMIVPFANIYLLYRYSREAARVFRNRDDWIAYFILYFFMGGVITLALVQEKLNKLARREKRAKKGKA